VTFMGWTHGDRTRHATTKRNNESARACVGPRHRAATDGNLLAVLRVIQDIIDRLHEAGSNTELHLLANRLQRLAFRATPVLSRK
jgi:hypothetical protein